MNFKNKFSTKRKKRSEDEFKYSTSNDLGYQAYKEAYERQADTGLKNSIGSLSAMTGGIPSSYAATAASQNYSRTMSKLYDKVPQLIDAAYNRYNSDRHAKLEAEKLDAQYDRDEYSRYADQRNFEYSRTRDNKKDEQWEKNYFRDIGNDKVKNDILERRQTLAENELELDRYNSNMKNSLSQKKQDLDEEKFNFDKIDHNMKNRLDSRKQSFKENAFDYKKVASMAEECLNADDPEEWLSNNAKLLTAEEYLWILSVLRKRDK